MLKMRKLAKEKQLKGKKRILRLDEAKQEEWDKYKVKLDKKIKRALEIKDNDKILEEI